MDVHVFLYKICLLQTVDDNTIFCILLINLLSRALYKPISVSEMDIGLIIYSYVSAVCRIDLYILATLRLHLQSI